MLGWIDTRPEPPQMSDITRKTYPELERLMSNAVCDERFALLTDPARALAHAGYSGRLSNDERALVSSVVGARSLAEFAAQLCTQLARSVSPAS
jgi:hypothetical protein